MITTTLFFRKIWSYIKKYWQLGLLVIASVVGYLLLRRERDGFVEQFRKLQDAHDDEIKQILNAYEKERKQHDENVKKLKVALNAVQKQYDDAKKVLDDKKKKKIAQIVEKHGDDPDELAKQLSAVTGFKIILPPGEK